MNSARPQGRKFENSPWWPGVKHHCDPASFFLSTLLSLYPSVQFAENEKFRCISSRELASSPLLLLHLILNSYLLSLFNSGSCISRNTSGWIQFDKYLSSTCLGARTSGSSNVKTYPRNSQSTEGNRHMKRSSVSLVVRTECYETQRREWWLILPHGGGLNRNQMKEKGHFWKRTWHKDQWGIKTSLLGMECRKTHWEKPRLRTYQRLCPGPKTLS